MAEYMRDVPHQKIKAREKHICPECFHYRVCMGRVNRPYFECDCFVPAANVRENVKGEWIGTGAVEYTMKCKGCSVCGMIRVIDNFCPNCGAKMGGAEDGK